jgi:hypothetical protein
LSFRVGDAVGDGVGPLRVSVLRDCFRYVGESPSRLAGALRSSAMTMAVQATYQHECLGNLLECPFSRLRFGYVVCEGLGVIDKAIRSLHIVNLHEY